MEENEENLETYSEYEVDKAIDEVREVITLSAYLHRVIRKRVPKEEEEKLAELPLISLVEVGGKGIMFPVGEYRAAKKLEKGLTEDPVLNKRIKEILEKEIPIGELGKLFLKFKEYGEEFGMGKPLEIDLITFERDVSLEDGYSSSEEIWEYISLPRNRFHIPLIEKFIDGEARRELAKYLKHRLKIEEKKKKVKTKT